MREQKCKCIDSFIIIVEVAPSKITDYVNLMYFVHRILLF